jgi:uncharacterized protein with HEPN domain
MQRDPRLYLHDMAECVRFLQSLANKHSKSDYASDRMLRSAIEREFITLGEAMSCVRRDHPQLAARIEFCRFIIDFRNVLVHGYFRLDPDVVWQTLTEDLAPLAEQIEGLLSEFAAPDDTPAASI